MRPLLAVVALLLVVPAAARADWSAPQTVGDLADAVTNPSIAFDGEGRALVTARYSEEDGVPSEGLTRMYTGRPGNVFRSFGIRMNLPVAPVVYGRRATAFLRRNAGSAPRILGTSFGSTTTSAGGFRALTSRASSDPFARRGDAYARTEDLDVNGAGLGVLAWVEPRGGGDLLRVALRRPGGAFHALQDLRGTGRVSAVTVAVGEGGDAVVAWQRVNGRERTIEARVRRGSQERFGHLQVIGESRGIAQVAADVAPTSRAVVAWGTQDGGEEAGEAWKVNAAVLAAGRTAFRAPEALDPGQAVSRPAGTVAVGMAADGTATVTWSGAQGVAPAVTFPVFAATTDADARFRVRSRLAESGAAGDVAVARDGTTLVVWGTLTEPGNNQQSDQVVAALRPSGAASYGAPELVGPRERARQPRAAFDPDSGHPAVVWSAQPGSPPLGQAPFALDQALRLATRTG